MSTVVVLNENPNDLTITVNGYKVAAAWGPLVDNDNWVVALPSVAPRRVKDRAEAAAIMARLRDELAGASPAADEGGA